jgi:hypothetical protein
MLTKNSYQPILRLTVRAAEDIPSYRFVDVNGHISASGAFALGVSDYPSLQGELISLIVEGTAIVGCSGNLTAGTKITSDATGKAIAAGTNDSVNGIVISNYNSDFAEILLTH